MEAVTIKRITEEELAKELRIQYIQTPPEGMTSDEVRDMSDEDLLDMDYFLHEFDDIDDDDLDCIKVKFEIEKPVGDLANKINFDLLNTFFNHQHEMTRSSSVNKTTMKNILNDGRDISIAKLVENTSLIIK